METVILVGLASIIFLGVGAQWLAWQMRLPAILLLLLFGFAAGPLTGFLDPDALFGDLLFPVVSLSVGLVLFDGGLSLKFRELRGIGGTVRNMIILGSICTWIICATASYYLLELDFQLSLLLGAILIGTGSTVIIPLLRQVRPAGEVGSILKWEAILIDPLGATSALLVFQTIMASGEADVTAMIVIAVIKTVAIGGFLGVAGGFFVTQMLRRFWIPDYLHSPVALMVAVTAFASSNLLQSESGLLATTVMGIYLANQRSTDVSKIIEFKGNLRVLLISSLFIVLAARLQISDFKALPLQSLLFLMIIIFVARPLSVACATLRSSLSWRERGFLACLAPRGIVSAAVASVFSMRLFGLEDSDVVGAQMLAPAAFLVIAGTVVFYGLAAKPAALWLRVAQAKPQGVLIVGSQKWSRALATAIKNEGLAVLLADTNWNEISKARMNGLPTYFGNILSEHAAEVTDLGGIGKLMALTSNEEVNSLITTNYSEVFGRAEVYQLPPDETIDTPKESMANRLLGRELFAPEATFHRINQIFEQGAVIKSTSLTEQFDLGSFRELYGESAILLGAIDAKKDLHLFTSANPPKTKPGDVLVSIVKPADGLDASSEANQGQ